jgi:hypothetical protein
MAISCAPSEEQLVKFFTAMVSQMKSKMDKKESYNLKDIINSYYNKIANAPNSNQEKAMYFVQQIPKFIIKAHGLSEEFADYLGDSGVNLGDVDKLRREFKDLPNIVKYLQLDTNVVKDAVNEIIKESTTPDPVTSTESYDEIEKNDQTLKTSQTKSFKAFPDTGLATLGQEAKTYDGFKAEDNILDEDPLKKAYYTLVRKLNDAIGTNFNANDVKIGDVKGIYLKLIPASSIPVDQLYLEEQNYLNRDDDPSAPFPNNKSSETKLSERSKNAVYLVYSDREGNILYFDENANITTKEAGGNMLYTLMRKPFVPNKDDVAKGYRKGVKTLGGIQSVDVMARRRSTSAEEAEAMRKQLQAARDAEIETLEKSREYILKNPDALVLFSIRPGQNGFVEEDFNTPTKISSITLEDGFKPVRSTTSIGVRQKGGIYFTVPGYPFPILIIRPKFSQVENLSENLANVLFDDKLSVTDKINTIKQFTYSRDTNVYEKDGAIVFKQNDTEYGVDKPENREIFINNLSNQVVNINIGLLNGTYKSIKMENGKLSFPMQPYNKFIADNFYTTLKTNTEGKIVRLNAYNVMDLTPQSFESIFETGQKKTEPSQQSTIEQSTPTDQSMDDFKKALNKFNFGLKKAKGLSSEATDEQIKQAKSWYEKSPLSKVVSFETLLNIVNSDAVAEFTLAGIRLFNGANYTDLYHEGWHVFSQLFLTLDQKQKLYQEARNLTGSFTTSDGRTVKFSEAKDIEIEEFLAEDFRKYVLSKGTRIIENRGARNNIFKKIYNFLKSLFKGYSYKQTLADQEAVGMIRDMYDKLYIGDVNQYKPSLNNVQFSLLNKGAQSLNATDRENIGLSYQDSAVLVETMDSLIAKNLHEAGVSLGSIFVQPEVMNLVYQKVKKDLEAIKKEFESKDSLSQSEQNALKALNFALDNWGDYNKTIAGEKNGMIAYHKMRSSYITFEDKFSNLSLDEQVEIEDQNVEKDVEGEELKKSEQELRDEFGSNTFERKGNENSVFEMASNEVVYLIKSLPAVDKQGKVQTNIYGVPKPVDFNSVWGKIINTTQGTIGETGMYQALDKASVVYPELKELVNRLGNPIEKTQKSDWAYVNMWGKFHRDFSVYKITVHEVRVVQDANGNFLVEFTETLPNFLKVERSLINNFENSDSKYIDKKNTGTEINVTNILRDFPNRDMNADKAFSFLQAIGIGLTDNRAVKAALARNTEGVAYIYDAVISGTESGNPIKFKSVSGRIRDILRIEAKYSGKYTNNSIELPTGDNAYDLSLNNTITQILKELNDAVKDYTMTIENSENYLPHMGHLNASKNPFAKFSVILNSMFNIDPSKLGHISDLNKRKAADTKSDSENVTLEILNLAGIKNVITSALGLQMSIGGIKTNETDINTKFLMDVHTMLLQGVMELPRHASKSTSYGVRASRLYTAYNQTKDKNKKSLSTHLYISSGHFATDTGMNAAVELMKDKLAAELQRIAIVKNGLVENVPGFNERGQQFTIFDDILTDNLQAKLIAKADATDSRSLLDTEEFTEIISNQIKAYFENLYQENLAFFNEMPFMSKQVTDATRKLIQFDAGITKMTDKEVTELAVKSFTVNAFIHNTETISLLYGDLAMYNHLKEEYHKRNSSIGSTGRIFSTDPSKYEFINNLGRGYAKKLGVESAAFDGRLKTVVFQDRKLPSVYHSEYVDALIDRGYTKEEAEKILSPYTDMNTGDAQGWITFDSYRILSILESNWSNKQDDLYNKIINNEDVDPADVAEFFPPRKFQYAGPVESKNLHLQAFHKFSLAPLVPSVIKNSHIKTLHDNMVKQGIDYALFESGSKLATVTKNGKADVLYNDENVIETWNEKDETRYTPNVVFLQYLKNQVDIAPHWKNKTIFSTQLRTLIINDLFKQGVPLNEEFNSLVTNFENLLESYQKVKKDELLNQMGWKMVNGVPTGNIEGLINFVRKEFTRQDLADHQIEFIDLNATNKQIKNDLSLSLYAEKIEKLLNAIVIKRLVRQKLNGEQLVQLANPGFESRNKFRAATDEENKQYNGTIDLPTYRPGKGSINIIYKKAFAELKSKKGDTKLFILESDLTDEIKEDLIPDTKNGERIKGSKYHGVNILGDFYSHKTLKSDDGDSLDVIVVKNKQDAEKQYQAYLKGGAKQFTGVGKINKNNKTSAAKVKIAIKGDYYKLFDLKHLDGEKIGDLDRLNEMIRDDKWLDKGNNRKLITLVGVRIPVQGFNSMEFMEVYEFLPEEAGNILIPPAEIVAKSGGDFDIDKLTIMMPNIGSDISEKQINKKALEELSKEYPSLDFSRNNINIILDAAKNNFEYYDLTAEEQKIYKILQSKFSSVFYHSSGTKGMENQIIETIREILEHPDSFAALIRPNDTDLVKTVADDLQKENIQGYDNYANKTNPTRKDKKGKNVISPTRALEPRYNLYKHESNNIGKKSLGIGAVDNGYSSIFKRIGAYLEKTYTKYKIDESGNIIMKGGKPVKETRRVDIKMDHNSIIIDGVEHISLSNIDTVTKDKVSDLISQLMNGWVDIEKDAWIFNINGNNIAGPVMLFMLEAGVDFKTAAHFVSQPLVVEYIKERMRMESPFYAAINGASVDKGLRPTQARIKMFEKYNIPGLKTNKEGNIYLSGKELYNTIGNYTDGVKFTAENLKTIIQNKDKEKVSREALAGFLHFIELEETTKQLTGIKLTVNVDTKPTKTLTAAQEKLAKIEDLERTDIMDNKFIGKIQTNSPKSSFFVQRFQLDVLKPLMSLRGNELINNYLIRLIKGRKNSKTFEDREKFMATFHNDLPLYILQNHIKNVDVFNIKEYSSLPISKTPTEKVMLKMGAFVKDGVMYIDPNQIKEDFESKAYAGEGYKELGLQVLPVQAFQTAPGANNIQNFREYSHYVLEREYLRSITPIAEGQSRKSYESELSERAMRKTFNFYYLLKSKNSLANEFNKIKTKYPEVANQFLIFDALVTPADIKDKNFKTFKFRSSRLDKTTINTLHENLMFLSDFSKVKVEDPIANREISNFFSRFIVAEYLRNGAIKGAESMAVILPTDNIMALFKEPMRQLEESGGFTEEMLNEYFTAFSANWDKNRNIKNKFRNYINSTVKTAEVVTPKVIEKTEEVVDIEDLVNDIDSGEVLDSITERFEDTQTDIEYLNEVVESELNDYTVALENINEAERLLKEGKTAAAITYNKNATGRIDNFIEDNENYIFNDFFEENATKRSLEIKKTLEHLVETLTVYKKIIGDKIKADTKKSISVNANVGTYTPVTEIAATKSLLASKPNELFIYPGNTQNKMENLTKTYYSAQNTMSIPIKTDTTDFMTDDLYNENIVAINTALDLIEQKIDEGIKVNFPQTGITASAKKDKEGNITRTEALKVSAPRTYSHLVTELYKRFGYIHPGAEKDLGFRELYQEAQPISDKEVEEFMKKCFGKK